MDIQHCADRGVELGLLFFWRYKSAKSSTISMCTLHSLPTARSENYIYLPVRSSITTVVIMEAELKQKKSPACIKHLLSLAEKVKMCLAISSFLWLCIAFRSLLSTDTVQWCRGSKTTSPPTKLSEPRVLKTTQTWLNPRVTTELSSIFKPSMFYLLFCFLSFWVG